ncbi:hypothetical protein [Robiginitalea aurantiaca]|uniref:Lipoprotein n=1 Tax=Robiginitalea aurantiaca TaxID=3056915 RepID=A0ABT7WBJ7_9FLAO|nr:hypothetical protein [Robiginitalea aurantiaca]MDM9630291.1 hypothetical protein [Robiginitalea aurantiaca]
MTTKRTWNKKGLQLLLVVLLLFLTSQTFGQIGEVKKEHRVIVGSSGDPQISLPYLEFIRISDKPGYYKLWYKDELHSRDKIKSLDFYASEMELNYLYHVFKDGYTTVKQRLSVGEGLILTSRPGRVGQPMKVTIYYENGSMGGFFLKEDQLERMLGSYKTVPSE